MRLSQAVDGFILFKTAEGLRPNTLRLYRHHLTQFTAWADDPPLEAIDADRLAAFLAYLRDDYRPPLSSQSVYNAWTALKSFYRWASTTIAAADPMTAIARPKVQNEEGAPFTEDEVRRLVAAVKPTKTKRATSGLRYVNALRDRAVILTLLDTGLRASELCALTIADVHLGTGRVTITGGKGDRSRHVWLGSHARAAVWQYLQERPTDPAAPLFAAGDAPLQRRWLHRQLGNIGRRAGVDDCHPHRFRYTFAIQYLRNGGDVFTLQSLLGHSTMKMVQYYLKLAQADVADAHRRASPVDRWLK